MHAFWGFEVINWTTYRFVAMWVHTNGNVTTWLNYWNFNWIPKLTNFLRVSFIWIGCMHFETLRLSIEPIICLQLYVSIKMISLSLGWITKTLIGPKSSLLLGVLIYVHVETCFSYSYSHWGIVSLQLSRISILLICSYIWATNT